MTDRRLPHPALLLTLAISCFVLLGLIGGATFPLDVDAIRDASRWRLAHPQAEGVVISYTYLGGAPSLLTLTGLGTAWLWWRRERRRAAALLSAALGARIGIEVLKLMVDRARPGLDAHPVVTHSSSFPSGHAGNSMATFLALALFVAPDRWRRTAVAVAVTASLAMGGTRPLLGVHWPSDVLAGWIYGATFALMAWWWLRQETGRTAA